MLAATGAHNLGFVHGRRGDVPAALAAFDRAAGEYADLGVDAGMSAVLLADRAQVLLDAGLIREAVQAASRAVELLAPTGNTAELAEAQLLQRAGAARCGRPGAGGAGAAAAAAFTAQGRDAWAVLAEYVQLTAGEGDVGRQAAVLAERLDAAGWTVEASTAHSQAARRALAARRARCRRHVTRPRGAQPAPRRPPPPAWPAGTRTRCAAAGR